MIGKTFGFSVRLFLAGVIFGVIIFFAWNAQEAPGGALDASIDQPQEVTDGWLVYETSQYLFLYPELWELDVLPSHLYGEVNVHAPDEEIFSTTFSILREPRPWQERVEEYETVIADSYPNVQSAFVPFAGRQAVRFDFATNTVYLVDDGQGTYFISTDYGDSPEVQAMIHSVRFFE